MRAAFVLPRVLLEAVRVEAERQHRGTSGEVCRALEAWLGWDREDS